MVKFVNASNSTIKLVEKPIENILTKAPQNVSQVVYVDNVSELNYLKLQSNLNDCLSVVENQVMKNYIPKLKDCEVLKLRQENIDDLEQIQFFRISALVYQEDEFSVHKLATIFNAMSNKPCTLVLMIQSDGENNDFYLGVRPRDSKYSSGTMRQMLEQSLLGLFPGSVTEDYYTEKLTSDLRKLNIGSVSSVTSIADYKIENEYENKKYIQGLEKFIVSMQGKPFTAIFIANNLTYEQLVDVRKEYENVYTLMSPFSNMQYNYAQNSSDSRASSETLGSSETITDGYVDGFTLNKNITVGNSQGNNLTLTHTDSVGSNVNVGTGSSHTVGYSDGTFVSDTKTRTVTRTLSGGINAGISMGLTAGANIGTSRSTSNSKSHTEGKNHNDSVSDTVSKNLTVGLNASKSKSEAIGYITNSSFTESDGEAINYSENFSRSIGSNLAYTKSLTNTFGDSQAITLNVQNKSLLNMMLRLDKLLERIEECESIGMWDFAAYFVGESAAEVETAAGMYRSLISGGQSGLEIASVNTWNDVERVKEINKYVTNFIHPIFIYPEAKGSNLLVDATSLTSSNELAIHLGLPRKSVKGLPVIEHALFAQEILSENMDATDLKTINMGVVKHLGKNTSTNVRLDIESLSMHAFVTGSTGSGKSNTVYQILSELNKKDVKFLVVEPAKGEYKNIFGNKSDVTVFGTNPLIMNLLRINPFSFPKEIHIYEHLDRLVEIFNVCWPMYAAMPAILKDSIERAYEKAGWNLSVSKNKYNDRLFPNFIDVLEQIDLVMEESQYSNESKGDYKGALSTRIRSLTNGINGLIFTNDELSSEELFDRNVIVDLSRVGSTETKSLIMGLLVMKLQEYRMSSTRGMNIPLKHVTVLEEAHNLLKRTSTDQSAESSNLVGKSVEMLTNSIAEMRTYGEGFIIVDQSPGLLDMAVIRNTNTKIIMRLPEYSDRELVGKSAGLNDNQIVELSKLTKGAAVIYQNDWLEAVLTQVKKYKSAEVIYQGNIRQTGVYANIKGQIITNAIRRKFYDLVDFTERDIINSDLSVRTKVAIFEYLHARDSDKEDLAPYVLYETLDGHKAFAELKNKNLDLKSSKQFILNNVNPSLSKIPIEKIRVILCMLIIWRRQIISDNSEILHMTELIKSEQEKVM